MEFETVGCLICGSKEYRPFLNVPERFRPADRYTLVQCSNCGFVYLNPRPTPANIGRFYPIADYDPHQTEAKSLFDRIYRAVRNINLKRKRRWIESFRPAGRLLDIGCGTGEFLLEMRQFGWEVVGTEPGEAARNFARRMGLPVFEDISRVEVQFDVITLWHVLEHVHDVPALFREIRGHLASDGLLLLALPNRESHDARAFASRWVAYDAPRHLYHFCPADVKKLAAQNGFRVLRLEALPFDPWYNALLSAGLDSKGSAIRKLTNYLNTLYIAFVAYSTGRQDPAKASSPVYFLQRENTSRS